jgi:hypothetical protein
MGCECSTRHPNNLHNRRSSQPNNPDKGTSPLSYSSSGRWCNRWSYISHCPYKLHHHHPATKSTFESSGSSENTCLPFSSPSPSMRRNVPSTASFEDPISPSYKSELDAEETQQISPVSGSRLARFASLSAQMASEPHEVFELPAGEMVGNELFGSVGWRPRRGRGLRGEMEYLRTFGQR